MIGESLNCGFCEIVNACLDSEIREYGEMLADTLDYLKRHLDYAHGLWQ